MNSILQRIKEEPVIVYNLAGAIIALVVAFGLSLSAAQIAAVLGVVAALMTFLVRGSVSPVGKLERLNLPVPGTEYADVYADEWRAIKGQ